MLPARRTGGVTVAHRSGLLSSGFEALTGLTGVLVTHIHEDHLDVDRLHALLDHNPDAQVVCDEASAALLAERGVKGHVVDDGDVVDLGVPIGVYGREHAIIHPDLPNVPNVGYLVADRFFTPVTRSRCRTHQWRCWLAVPVGAAWMKLSEAVDYLRRVVLRPQIADTQRQEHAVRNSGLDWVIAQPVRLTDGPQAGLPFASPSGELGAMKVSRGCVGRFLVQAAEGSRYVGASVALSAAAPLPAATPTA